MIEALAKENYCVTVDEIATSFLNISHGSAHHVVHAVLQSVKISERWVPHQLTNEMREPRVDGCDKILRRSDAVGDDFLRNIATGSDTRVHCHQPETEKASKKRRHYSSTKIEKETAQSLRREGLCWRPYEAGGEQIVTFLAKKNFFF